MPRINTFSAYRIACHHASVISALARATFGVKLIKKACCPASVRWLFPSAGRVSKPAAEGEMQIHALRQLFAPYAQERQLSRINAEMLLLAARRSDLPMR